MIIKEKPGITSEELIRLVIPSADTKHWPEEIIQEAILAEYLREIIYVLSTSNNENRYGSFTPVYIGKIIKTLRNHLDVVWPRPKQTKFFSLSDTNEDEDPLNTNSIKRILNSLQLLGDIMHVGGGFWVPAPFRLIQLSDSEDIGVVGGWPNKHLSRTFQTVINSGYGRILKKKQVPQNIFNSAHVWQSFESWRGWVPRNITEWTESQVKQARISGSQCSESYSDYELYISFRSKRYYKSSWVQLEDFDSNDLQNHVLLCRTRMQPRSYFLGVFQKGKLVKEFSLDGNTVAWLRLGLRFLHGTKPSAKWDGNWLRVFTPLPINLEKELFFYFYKVQAVNFTSYYVQENFKGKVEVVLRNFGYILINKGENPNG